MGRLSAASRGTCPGTAARCGHVARRPGPGSAHPTTVLLPVNVEFRGVGLAVGLAAAAVVATTFLVIAGLETASAMQVLTRDRRVPDQLPPQAQLVRRVLLAPLAMRGIDLEHDPELPAIALPGAAELAAVVKLRCTVLIPAHDEEAVLGTPWTRWRHRRVDRTGCWSSPTTAPTRLSRWPAAAASTWSRPSATPRRRPVL